MREQLIKYVELLFAGAPGARDIQQEILQNTLDRYDDLIAQGKSPEAAYSLSISGIGDLSEILGNASYQPANAVPVQPAEDSAEASEKKIKKAVAIAFYILCPIPLFILSEYGHDTIGLCLTLLLVAAATALLIIAGKDKKLDETYTVTTDPIDAARQVNRRSARTLIWSIGLAVYFIMSIITNAWYITWIVFPLTACVQGLTTAIMDLKEA